MSGKCLANEPYSIGDGVTQSLLSNWVDCRHRARLSLSGWKKPETKESLVYGSMFHRALEFLYTDVRAKKIKKPADAMDLPQRVADEWASKYPVATPEAHQQTQLLLAQLGAVWPAYVKQYAKTDFKSGTWMEVEGTFDVQWRSWRLRGRRDGMRKINNKLWLFETKTKSQISEQAITNALGFDFQSLFYITANETELAQRKKKLRTIRGVIYNVIRKPQFKQKGTETLAAYSQRVAADVQKDPNRWFMRYEAVYEPEQLQKFQDCQLAPKLFDFQEWLEGNLPTYRNEGACQKRWTCEFLTACGQDNMVGYEQEGRLFEELEE